MMSQVTVTTITQLYDAEKIKEGSKINDVI